MNKGYVFTILNYSITDTTIQYTRIKTANRLVKIYPKAFENKTLDDVSDLLNIK